MQIQGTFAHYNFNVLDLQASLSFYQQALGLKEHHRKQAADGSFILCYLTDGHSPFLLELTWLRDWNRPYNLGDNEMHLCFTVPAAQYDQIREAHRAMGCICFENTEMGLYFIGDPDGYWLEILPER